MAKENVVSNRKVYVEVIEYRKKETGEVRKCCVLKVDLGYGYKPFNARLQSDFAEILDIKISDLKNLNVGDKFYLN